ncbi:SdrD B-like domain-containing protein [Demequina aurantiaca]|uniref:SdrD B-like domain-containing protein n=1 Tax=Demequina aurantiaca TaxID=676200 RepID=UPI000782D8E1|nr:SdrD B-like domain-containing protein [Demequina aurantiaca]
MLGNARQKNDSGTVKRRIAATVAAVLALSFALAPAATAVENPVDRQALLEVTKEVATPSDKLVVSGGDVTWNITVNCQSDTIYCWDTTLTDVIPAPFVYVPGSIQFTSDGDWPAPTVTEPAADNGQTLSVVFNDYSGSFPGKTGLASGHGLTFSVTANLPLSQEIPGGGEDILNTATLTSTDESVQDAKDGDTVHIEFAAKVVANVNKSWSEDSVVAGDPSNVGVSLDAWHTSNVPAQSLVINDPVGPSTAFDKFSFVGFTGLTLPNAADHVAVSLALDGGGSLDFPAAATLPTDAQIATELAGAGKALTDIMGVTATFTNPAVDGTIAANDHAKINFAMAQRDSITGGQTVDNLASANVTTAYGDDTAAANDAIDIESRSLSSSASKVYTDAAGVTLGNNVNVVTGQTFGGLATLTSSGNVSLDSLTINDPALDPVSTLTGEYAFSDQGVTFNGFGADGTNTIGAASSVPSGATGATVTYTYVGGATEVLAATLNSPGITFPAASGVVDGFSITYSGDLAPDASARIPYSLTAGATPVSSANNSADGQVTSGAENAVAPPATDEIAIVVPHVESTTDKNIVPGQVSKDSGSTFVSILSSRLDKTNGTPLSNVPVNQLVIEDSTATGGDVWTSTFRPTGLTSSSLPTGVTATFELFNGSDWSTYTAPGPFTGYIPEVSFGYVGGVDGVRVTYTSTDGSSIDESQRYRTLLEWTAIGENAQDTYTNTATSRATGTNPATGEPVVGDEVADSDTITTVEGSGGGGGDGDTPIAVTTVKDWTVSGDSAARALGVPLWVPNTGNYPKFGLAIGVENSSEHGVPVDSLSLQEPAVGPQDIGSSTVAQTEPFDTIQLLSLNSVVTPDNADLTTFSVTLTPQGGSATTFGPGLPNAVTPLVNTFLAANTDVDNVEFYIEAKPGGIETGERFSARFATQVRTVTLSGVAVDPDVLAVAPETIDNVVLGSAVYGEYAADAADQDDVELRALSTQPVTVKASKSLSPNHATILSDQESPTVTMTLGANKFAANATRPDVDSFSNPISYELTDITPAFWDIFTLKGATQIIGEPTNSSVEVKFSIEYQTPTGWLTPDGATADGFDVPQGSSYKNVPASAKLPPAGYTFADVTGVRVKFWTEDGVSPLPDMSTSTNSLNSYGQKIRFGFELRSTFRDSGDAIPDGTSVTNSVDVHAVNAQGRFADDDASATFRVDQRTSKVTIKKTPDGRTAPAGTGISFGLSLKNEGTTAVRGLVLTDTIQCVGGKPDMIYDAETAAIALGTGATDAAGVTTDPKAATVTYTTGCVDGTDTVSIALPAADTVWPGETYAITVPLTVSAGHEPGDFKNSYGLSYTDELGDAAVGPVTVNIYVPVAPGFWFSKYVREVVDTDAGQMLTGVKGVCRGTEEEYLSGELDPWQRIPCVVKTQPGGTEEWRIWLTNAGNQPTKQLVAVDVLPTPGDVGITTGLSTISRGSEFTPTLLAGIDVEWLGSEGTLEIEYQTAANAGCVLTGGVDEQDPFNPECNDWESDWDSIKDDASALAAVTALRFNVMYADDALLQPGEAVKIYFKTKNPETLPEAAPADDAPAWNSFGGWAQTVTNPRDEPADFNFTYFRTAPLKAGVVVSQPDPPLAIGDRVWIDENRNGVQDPGEEPLPGVTVRLHELDGTVVGETVTGVDGDYVFEGLYPGTYRVSFELTAEQRVIYMATLPKQGDGADDSNIAAEPVDGSYWSDTVTIDYPSRGDAANMVSAADYNALDIQQITAGSYIDPTIDAGFMLIDPKWLKVAGESQCISDAPWFYYDITTSNFVEQGLPFTISWYPDANQDMVPDGPAVQVDTMPAGSALNGRILWPGAEIDPTTEWGTAWPGWRVATRDETPKWENLIYDPTLFGADLRDGALVIIEMNPTGEAWQVYPTSTPTCEEDRVPNLSVTKSVGVDAVKAGEAVSWDLVVENAGPGASNDVTLTDQIPAELRVTDVAVADPTDDTQPEWDKCTVTGADNDGYGGSVACVLDGWLGIGQSAPPVTITTTVNPEFSGDVVNGATVTWTDPDEDDPMERSDDDNATVAVSASGSLSMTGLNAIAPLGLAAVLLLVGFGLMAIRRGRN